MNRAGKALLVLALVAVVGMAFRVSWNALRDVATAVGADETGATLYPFVVDGLMALALVATLVLTDRADKRFALRVLAAYTAASLVLNFVHGLVPELHGESVDWTRLADWDAVNWLLVLLATSLPVGSIYFGSDLVAKVLHHRPIDPTNAEKSTQIYTERSTSDVAEPASEPVPALVGSVAVERPEEVDSPLDAESTDRVAVRVVAAEQSVARRATGRVPDAARSTRPRRTADELLSEARQLTESWPVEQLTAEGIRKALRTSPDKARLLRETLRVERTAEQASEPVAVS
ncbi:DUF2637 domain-containing protein [Streptomyces sp. SP18CS02]|uniref:DUF2637 domain-containing protein n=1 Tax=Streptomyces sp. SP18CS02 TaxID=3002531 RepID=UPI002E7A2C98|nr:DUF2637 domain-containing protein [Streptomyces sp. SP18CS02]MEE1754200.1 DUF2637 domain-containing protein [Streptomyces sp. SP18CS02]